MEIANINKQSLEQPQPVGQPPQSHFKNKKGFYPIILGVIFLVLIIGGGAYYLGTKNNKPTEQTSNNRTISSPTSVPTQSTQTSKQSDCLKAYKNDEQGFSFMYPCKWGDIQEKWTLSGQGVTGNELSLNFPNLIDKLDAGGASNDFTVGRGSIFQDISDKYWKNYLSSCSDYLLCNTDKNTNNRVISRLVFPERFNDNQLTEEQVTVPQFNPSFRKEAYFDIFNAKISIVGFRYDFIADKEQFLTRLSQMFPSYVKLTKKINTGAAYVTLQEAKAYNQDIEKMKNLDDKNEFELPFDEVTKQNLDDFNATTASFKFLK